MPESKDTSVSSDCATSVSSKQRTHLRSLAHRLEPLVHVGGGGVTDGLRAAVTTALRDHELIKVKLGKSFSGERRPVARDLAQAVQADLVQLIGRVIVLYRPRPAKEGDQRPRIEFPKAARTKRAE